MEPGDPLQNAAKARPPPAFPKASGHQPSSALGQLTLSGGEAPAPRSCCLQSAVLAAVDRLREGQRLNGTRWDLLDLTAQVLLGQGLATRLFLTAC